MPKADQGLDLKMLLDLKTAAKKVCLTKNYNKFFKAVGMPSLTDVQLNILDSVLNLTRTTTVAGLGAGKSHLIAVTALFFMMRHIMDTKVIITSYKHDQLSSIIIPYISSLVSNSSILANLLEVNSYRCYVKVVPTCATYFLSWSREGENKDISVQGQHAKNLLIVIDEAAGMPTPIINALDATLTGENNHILMCGNPNKNFGKFHDSHKDASWNSFRMSCLNNPFVTSEWVTRMEQTHGKDSVFYKQRVLGLFVPISSNCLLTPDLLKLIEIKDFEIPKGHETSKSPSFKSFGFDPAIYGDRSMVCESLIYLQYKTIYCKFFELNYTSIREQCFHLRNFVDRDKDKLIVDATGLGIGFVEELRSVYDLRVFAINFASKGNSGDNTANARTQLYVNFAKLLREGYKVFLNTNEVYENIMQELLATEYAETAGGKLGLCSKKSIHAALGRSPDSLDALVLSLAYITSQEIII